MFPLCTCSMHVWTVLQVSTPCIKYCWRSCGDKNSTTKCDGRTYPRTYVCTDGQGQNYMPLPTSWRGHKNIRRLISLDKEQAMYYIALQIQMYSDLAVGMCWLIWVFTLHAVKSCHFQWRYTWQSNFNIKANKTTLSSISRGRVHH